MWINKKIEQKNEKDCYLTKANFKIFHWQIWVKVFKKGPSKICGRHYLKNLKRYGLLRQIISLQIS